MSPDFDEFEEYEGQLDGHPTIVGDIPDGEEFDEDDDEPWDEGTVVTTVIPPARYDTPEYRDDVFAILDHAPNEVPGVLAAIREGRIEGCCYSGECRCLIGTIAKLRGIEIFEEVLEMPGIGSDPLRPAERFFSEIQEGHTPANSSYSALAQRWVLEWIEREAAKGASLVAT